MNDFIARVALLAAWLFVPVAAAGETAAVLAPGYGPLQYEPPAAGSYRLPPLGTAADGRVIDDRGEPLSLYELFSDKFVLLGFIYTHCSDVNGCPLATFVMKKVQDRLYQDAELGSQLRLISLSFDPELDTPQVLHDYAGHFRREGADWRFLTTASEAQLQPILEGYDQWRQKEYDKNGDYSGSMSHILRVYLIDKQRRIRNIYSTGFLDAETVVNDLRTLSIEASRVD
ncbi:MAG: SCO family protein [Halieaceae bacterium]|jgi:cytochrome c peroxidase|nr:SCO family protein [Halieaceae bacterium]